MSVLGERAFEGQTVMVTGGGSGIGAALAESFCDHGASMVVLVGRTLAKLEAVAARLGERAGLVTGLLCEAVDIRDRAGVEAMVGRVLEASGGRVDVLVNCAGGQYIAAAEDISYGGWKAVVETNLTGTWNVIQEVFLGLGEEKLGGLSIVNIVVDNFAGMPRMAHSGAARAGVVNLTASLAVEWGAYGVRVNAVAPGVIASSGLTTYPDAVRRSLPAIAAACPAGRAGSESEVAAAVLFLASRSASYVTGTVLRVDGGSSLLKGLRYPELFPDTPPVPPYHTSEHLADVYSSVMLPSKL